MSNRKAILHDFGSPYSLRLFALAVVAALLAGTAYLAYASGSGAQQSSIARDGPQKMVRASSHAMSVPAGTPIRRRDAVVRGAYLARLGSCLGCHTAPGGAQYAGGIPMGIQGGTVYSSNLTPDAQTGIGDYTFEDFDRAVRAGISKRNGNLYPRMPYAYYARISKQDMQDLYAYFMSLTPMRNELPVSDASGPSARAQLSAWRANLPDPDKLQTEAAPGAMPGANPILRGAYLVEGVAHCGACHTPRSQTGQEKGFTSTDPDFLAGGAPANGWVAKNLRGDGSDGLVRWSKQDIVDLLKTGRNAHSAVFGGMTGVVSHGTQYANEADLHAIAAYLKALPATPGAPVAAFNDDASTANALWKGDDSQRGAALYLDNCAACHRTDGKGYEEVFPALAGNSIVLSDEPHNLVSIILNGQQVPATDSRPSTFDMPAFGWRLTNAQVADLATFVRASWGNQAGPVSDDLVDQLRPKPAAASSGK